MSVSPTRQFVSVRRLVSAAVLLFVFFLPLHVHFFSAATRVNNDCSCVYNTKTQAAPAATAVHWTPTFHGTFVAVEDSQAFRSPSVQSYAIRAPPSFFSL